MPGSSAEDTHFTQKKTVLAYIRAEESENSKPPTALTTFLPHIQYLAHNIILPGTLAVVSPVSQNPFMMLLTDFPKES